MNEQFQKELTALKTGVALQLRPDAGLLALGGEDRSDFLQRMTSNDIKRLKPGQSAVTVLTSPTARTLFVFTVVCRENELWLLPSPGETTLLERHLRGNIFFMDKVTVRNLSNDWQRARLMGATAPSALSTLGIDPSLADDGWQEASAIVAIHQQKYDLPGYELLLAADWREASLQKLEAAGAVTLDGQAAYTARRIDLGRPAPGAELTSDYTPLESGLAWACAENKGCYTGQEIIARQITYDKVTKGLAKISSDQIVRAGATVTVDGKDAGTVTTVSPELSTALAILKRPFNSVGTSLQIEGNAATVVEFSQSLIQ